MIVEVIATDEATQGTAGEDRSGEMPRINPKIQRGRGRKDTDSPLKCRK